MSRRNFFDTLLRLAGVFGLAPAAARMLPKQHPADLPAKKPMPKLDGAITWTYTTGEGGWQRTVTGSGPLFLNSGN